MITYTENSNFMTISNAIKRLKNCFKQIQLLINFTPLENKIKKCILSPIE